MKDQVAKNNTLALVSLITGIVNFICCGVIWLVPVITGIIALTQIKKTGEGGKGMAIAGLVMGGIAVVWFIASMALGLAASMAEAFMYM